MKTLFTGSDPIAAGASLEGIQNLFTAPPNESSSLSRHPLGGYFYLEIAQATLTFKIQARLYNGSAWMKWHDLTDAELASSFDPTSAAVKCEFTLEDQDFWKIPIFGVQVYYLRLTGSASAAISNAILETYK